MLMVNDTGERRLRLIIPSLRVGSNECASSGVPPLTAAKENLESPERLIPNTQSYVLLYTGIKSILARLDNLQNPGQVMDNRFSEVT
jgi:hypothetical protein